MAERELLILGTGVHGAEMAEIVERINAARPADAGWKLVGFVAARTGEGAASVGTVRAGYPVLGWPEALEVFPGADLVPDNEWPRSIPIPVERLVSLVDPSAVVSRTAHIGRGCVIYPQCFIGLNARLDDFVFCLSGCVINHDDVLEDHVVLASGVTLAGSVHVEAGCYMGQSCTVRQRLRIGAGSLIGMGAVVVRDVPPGSVMVGNPARLLRRSRDARPG